MPLTLSAAVLASLKRQGSGYTPVTLLDLEVRDGTRYFWSDWEGSFPAIIGGGTQAYSPWLKRRGMFRWSRSLRSDIGNITVQNLSGSTIERDVGKVIKAKEFVGALAVIRFWDLHAADVIREFHGRVGWPEVSPEELQLQFVQLFNASEFRVPFDVYSEQCTWRYKSLQCGSASGEAVCSFTMADCKVRAAIERFNGVPLVMPVFAVPTAAGGGGSSGGGGNSGGGMGAGHDFEPVGDIGTERMA